MIGQTISNYKIIDKLGEGGMGVVYKAHDTQLDRFVALKFLPHYLNSDPVEKERFYHEARATSALNHPNITTIYEITEHDNQLYIAMEFVEGLTLKKLVEKEIPSTKTILDIAIQACDGVATLATAHGGSKIEKSAALQKAYALSGPLSERERLIIQNAYVSGIENDVVKASKLMEEYIQKFPHEKYAYLNLGVLYARNGEHDRSIDAYRRGLRSDSLDKNLWNLLAYSYSTVHKKAEALSAIERYLQLAPAEPNPYDSKGDIYLLTNETDSALAWWKKALKFRSDFNSGIKSAYQYLIRDDYANTEKFLFQNSSVFGEEQQLYADASLVAISMRQGKFNQCYRRILELLLRHIEKKNSELLLNDYSDLVFLSNEVGDFEAAEKYARMFDAELKKDPFEMVAGSDMLAYALLKNGKPQRALETLRSARKNYDRMNPEDQANVNYADGLLAYELERYDDALQYFQKALKRSLLNRSPQYHYALSMLKTGRTKEAIDELQRFLCRSPLFNRNFDASYIPFSYYGFVYSVKAHYWLGVAYEQQSEKQKAISEYEKFLLIWKDADFKSKEMDDAKSRLTKLKGATAS